LASDNLIWLTEWNLDPSLLIGLVLFCGIYLYGVGPLRQRFGWASEVNQRQIVLFLSGAFAIFVALVLPLDEIGDHYLFSAHMVQHLLLTLVMPPLVLLGTPGWLLRPVLQRRLIADAAKTLTKPVVAFLVFNGVFITYHVPAIYELALENDTLHIFFHLLLMATGVITWMPILSPLAELPRLSYPLQVLYLFFESIPQTLLAAVITFSNSVLIPTYMDAPRVFGISAIEDQQAAGLIMWVVGAIVYLSALTIVFFKWFGNEDSPETANEAIARWNR
jgi:putative membrane protein